MNVPTMEELTAGVQKIFEDAVRPTPSHPMELEKTDTAPGLSEQCGVLHTTLSTYLSERERERESAQEIKGGV